MPSPPTHLDKRGRSLTAPPTASWQWSAERSLQYSTSCSRDLVSGPVASSPSLSMTTMVSDHLSMSAALLLHTPLYRQHASTRACRQRPRLRRRVQLWTVLSTCVRWAPWQPFHQQLELGWSASRCSAAREWFSMRCKPHMRCAMLQPAPRSAQQMPAQATTWWPA